MSQKLGATFRPCFHEVSALVGGMIHGALGDGTMIFHCQNEEQSLFLSSTLLEHLVPPSPIGWMLADGVMHSHFTEYAGK